MISDRLLCTEGAVLRVLGHIVSKNIEAYINLSTINLNMCKINDIFVLTSQARMCYNGVV